MMTIGQPPADSADLLPDRKLALGTLELREVLRWEGGDDPHPLDDLEKLLLASCLNLKLFSILDIFNNEKVLRSPTS